MYNINVKKDSLIEYSVTLYLSNKKMNAIRPARLSQAVSLSFWSMIVFLIKTLIFIALFTSTLNFLFFFFLVGANFVLNKVLKVIFTQECGCSVFECATKHC